MIEIIGSLLTSAVGGGATGLLGVLLQRWFDHRKAQQDIEITKLQLQASREARQMELEHQAKMADRAAQTQALHDQLEAQAREAEADARALIASYEHDGAKYLSPAAQQTSRSARWMMAAVDAIRGLMRPGITAYTLWMLTVLMWWVRELYLRSGQALTAAQLHDLTMQVVQTIIYLAVTTVVWWFGVRPGQPPGARK